MSFPWSPLQVLYKAIYGIPREAEPATEPLNLPALAARITHCIAAELEHAHHVDHVEVFEWQRPGARGDLPTNVHLTTDGKRVICHAALHELQRAFGRRP